MAYRGLLVASAFPPFKGGIQNYLYHLYDSLPQGRFRILSRRQPDSRKFDARQVLSITRIGSAGKPRIANLSMLVAAAYIAQRHRIKDVHCGVVLPDGLVGYTLKKLTGRPYLVYTYAKELYVEPKREATLRRVLSDADRVVTISRFTRNRLVELGVDEQRIAMIPPAVDTDFFSPRSKNAALVTALGLEDKKVILSAGRQVERKGTDTVIRALPEIIRAIPNVKYVVAGKGQYLPYLKRLTTSLAMNDYVQFVGSPEDEEMPDYYSICDVFSMVNRTLTNNDCEGFGIVFLEAGACGRPVVGGASGGVHDAVVNGETGFLADPWDPREVADYIIRLLKDDGLAERMGRAGRCRTVDQFSTERQSELLANLIGLR